MRPGGPGKRARNNRGHMRRGGGGSGGGSGGGGNRNQSFDSTGPDVKVRGTAQQVADKYIALARDASSSGDRVAAENYLQHAEHYQRIVNVYAERAAEQQRERDRDRGERSEDEGGEAQTESRRNRNNGGDSGRNRDAENDDDERSSTSEDDEQDQPAA